MILVTGKNGELSIALRDYLIKNNLADTECISVRGDEWENISFSGAQAIIHIAGIVPKPGVAPEEYYAVNRDLTIRIAQKAKRDGVKHFIYISSMAVYGIAPSLKPEKGTVTSSTPCIPTSDYGKSKLEAEIALQQLEDPAFGITIIRVPSIYSPTKTEYFSQYRLIVNKFYCIPIAFTKCYRSAISLPDLCELIRLVILNNSYGIICPDSGIKSASDYCKMIYLDKHRSRLVGILIEIFLRQHTIIRNLFGTVAYDPTLTNVFNGNYRIT